MKKLILCSILITSASFAASGNQANIADLKEAVYKLILLNEKQRRANPTVSYKPLTTGQSHLDSYLKSYVQKNRQYLPK